MLKHRSNRDIFLAKLKAKHDLSNYDFSDTVYKGKLNPISFKCKHHGVVTNNHPTNLFRSDYICSGCKLDALKIRWLDRVTDIHDDRYNYSQVVYNGLTNPVEIICGIHGSFWQTPETHIKAKVGCPTCARETDRLDTTEFIRRAKELFGDRYDYGKSVYTLWSEPITVTCPEHGDWETRAGSHLSGTICLECSIMEQRSDKEEFVKKARKVHGNKYDYSDFVYVHSKYPAKVRCSKHGLFEISPNRHISGRSGCPRCAESLGELQIRNFLEDLGIVVIQEYTLPGFKYRMDFHLPDQNIFIEHHGVQHYYPVDFFGGVVGFRECQVRDQHKADIARDMGIPLVVTNYNHLNDGKLIEQLICELKNIYLFWFITWDDEVIVFKHKSDLRKALDITQRYTTDKLVNIAESENGWVLLF